MRMSHAERASRRERVVQAAIAGKNKQEIMDEFMVGETLVKTACRNAGVVLKKPALEMEDKCFQFVRRVIDGESPHKAAVALGIGENRLQQLLRAAVRAELLSKGHLECS